MTKSTLTMVLMLGILAVLLVSVAGCTSPNSTSATNNALAYAKAFAAYWEENQTVRQVTISANGTDGAQLTLLTTSNTSSVSDTTAFNIRQFASVADASSFYNSTSFGYVQVGNSTSPDPTIYSSVTGHAPSVNNAAVKIENFSSFPFVYQQGEFVVWGTESANL
jgi:hypothetical protein